MIRTAAVLFALAWLAAGAALAQDRVAAGPGAELRALDRLSGELIDLSVRTGDAVRVGRLSVNLVECRYPVDNPVGDAFAYLLIDDLEAGRVVFEGWMVASSPALNPLDHMRYDVWVLRCTTS